MSRPQEDVINDHIERLKQMPRLSCAGISNITITGTPVLSGSLRASWNGSIGAPEYRKINISADNPYAARTALTSTLNSLKPGDSFFFVNGQPYAARIEYEGWSAKAPSGMMRKALTQWQSVVDDVARTLAR